LGFLFFFSYELNYPSFLILYLRGVLEDQEVADLGTISKFSFPPSFSFLFRFQCWKWAVEKGFLIGHYVFCVGCGSLKTLDIENPIFLGFWWKDELYAEWYSARDIQAFSFFFPSYSTRMEVGAKTDWMF
jgi:hypothetical protein